MTLALDRKAINKVVFDGLNLARLLPDLAGQPLVRRRRKGCRATCTREQAAAQKLVKASGIATPITVRLMLGTDPVAARLGQVIQAMVKEVGFNVELDPTEFVSSLNRADAGKFDTFFIGWSGRIDPDGNIYRLRPHDRER